MMRTNVKNALQATSIDCLGTAAIQELRESSNRSCGADIWRDVSPTWK